VFLRTISASFPTGSIRISFIPLPGVQRPDNQLLVTNSADTPLKGLRYLLEAVASIRQQRDIRLTVIGAPKKDGEIERLARDLNLNGALRFTGGSNTRTLPAITQMPRSP